MSEAKAHFNRRLDRLGRKHKAMGDGYTTSLRKDGLLVATPRRKPRRLPLRPLMFVAVAVMVSKVCLLSYLGETAYQARLDRLAQGGTVERAGAWTMSIDPVTRALSQRINEFSG
ncbi:MAG: hypothetical protein NXH82_15870 [Rhodobacteraceae bacterium]|nr:hypothetical protein [Paracoccaceae bacterium]